MKSQKKKAKTITQKQLETAISQQSHFAASVALEVILLDLFKERPEDFKTIFAAYEDNWTKVSPYEDIENLTEMCDEIAASLSHHCFYGSRYPKLIHSEGSTVVGLVKNKKNMDSIEKLLDFVDLVCDSGAQNAHYTLAEEGKIN